MKITRVDAEWFKQRILAGFGSQRRFAERLRGRSGKVLDHTAVTKILRGDRGVYVEEAAAIAELLGVPLLEVIRRLGVSSAGAPMRAARAR